MNDAVRTQTVRLVAELPEHQAEALAQFLKRLGYEDCRRIASSAEEAYGMIDGAEKVRAALAESGFAPR